VTTPSEPPSPADYPHRRAIPTRWKDNDVYGHVNNVEYYSFFDTVINAWLIEEGYEIGLFGDGGERLAATGWFVHVFVDRDERRSVEIPERMRSALERLRVA